MLSWVLVLSCYWIVSKGVKVNIKVVEAHSQIGQGHAGGLLRATKLKPSREPGSLCSHPALRQLLGKCYELEEGEYKYRVCPFQNITQHEVALKWNAYHGILGIWEQWNYDPLYSTLTFARYTDGDSCAKGDKTVPRIAHLYNLCGKRTRVTSVSEPQTCQYNLTLESPLFCHDGARDVFSALPEENRAEFEESYLEFKHNILTEKGVAAKRVELLERIGCLKVRKEFTDLEECSKEYQDLYDKNKELEKQLSEDVYQDKYSKLQMKYDELFGVLTDNGLVLPESR